MTQKEFEDWWYTKSFRTYNEERQKAWNEFLLALEAEYKCPVSNITKIPPHVYAPFMAGCILIFG